MSLLIRLNEGGSADTKSLMAVSDSLTLEEVLVQLKTQKVPFSASIVFENKELPALVFYKLEPLLARARFSLEKSSPKILWEVVSYTFNNTVFSVSIGKIIAASEVIFTNCVLGLTIQDSIDNAFKTIRGTTLADNVDAAECSLLLQTFLTENFSAFEAKPIAEQLSILAKARALSADSFFIQEFIKRVKIHIAEAPNAETLLPAYKVAATYSLFSFPDLAKAFDNAVSKFAQADLIVSEKIFSSAFLAVLEQFTAIRKIGDLTCGVISDSTLMQLAKCDPCLGLHFCASSHITTQGVASLAQLSLQDLDMRYCTFLNDHDLQNLSVSLKLNHLNLRDCSGISTVGIQFAASISSLRALSVQDCDVTDENVQALGRLKFLRDLDLSWCLNITGQGLQHLVAANSLQSLDLSGCILLTDGDLVPLGQISSLKYLRLSRCKKITDEGVISLNTNPSLNYLDLSYCLVTGRVWQYLATFSSLISLNLSYCVALGDSGDTKSKLSNLKFLDLTRCTQMTDEAFLNLPEFPMLQSLNLTGCTQISETILQEVKTYLQLFQTSALPT